MYVPRNVPNWVIPTLGIALFASWFLAMRSPTGAAIAAVAGAAFWWLTTFKKAREAFGLMFIIGVFAVFIAAGYWLGGFISL